MANSLLILLGIYILFWLIAQIFKYSQQKFLPPNFLSNALSNIAGIMVAISQTLNTPVLYWRK
jgi:hypothetical protein